MARIHTSTTHHAYLKQDENIIAMVMHMGITIAMRFCRVYDKRGGLCYCVCVHHHRYEMFALFMISVVARATVHV